MRVEISLPNFHVTQRLADIDASVLLLPIRLFSNLEVAATVAEEARGRSEAEELFQTDYIEAYREEEGGEAS